MAENYAADLANLQLRRSNIIAELAAMGPTKAGGKPNASGPGVNVDHVGYRRSLYQELKDVEHQIRLLDGPYELETRGY